MPGPIAYVVYDAILAYAATGGVVAVAFLLFGLERVDPSAVGAYAFRPLLVPGLVLLWPVVLIGWRRGAGHRQAMIPPRRLIAAHLRIWIGLAVVLPVILLAAWNLRQNAPGEAAPVKLSD